MSHVTDSRATWRDEFAAVNEKMVNTIGRRLAEQVKLIAGVSRVEQISRPQREAFVRGFAGRLRVSHLLKEIE